MQLMYVCGISIPYHAQILTHGCFYTCPIKQIDGEWYFRFKKQWHKVNDYSDEHTRILKI